MVYSNSNGTDFTARPGWHRGLSNPPASCPDGSALTYSNPLMCTIADTYAGTDQESTIIPSSIVVRLIKANVLIEKANETSDGRYDPMPKTTEKAGGICTCQFVF